MSPALDPEQEFLALLEKARRVEDFSSLDFNERYLVGKGIQDRLNASLVIPWYLEKGLALIDATTLIDTHIKIDGFLIETSRRTEMLTHMAQWSLEIKQVCFCPVDKPGSNLKCTGSEKILEITRRIVQTCKRLGIKIGSYKTRICPKYPKASYRDIEHCAFQPWYLACRGRINPKTKRGRDDLIEYDFIVHATAYDFQIPTEVWIIDGPAHKAIVNDMIDEWAVDFGYGLNEGWWNSLRHPKCTIKQKPDAKSGIEKALVYVGVDQFEENVTKHHLRKNGRKNG